LVLNRRSKASHSWLPAEERAKLGITENMLRLSVGLESPTKLMQDLDQALRKALPTLNTDKNNNI